MFAQETVASHVSAWFIRTMHKIKHLYKLDASTLFDKYIKILLHIALVLKIILHMRPFFGRGWASEHWGWLQVRPVWPDDECSRCSRCIAEIVEKYLRAELKARTHPHLSSGSAHYDVKLVTATLKFNTLCAHYDAC